MLVWDESLTVNASASFGHFIRACSDDVSFRIDQGSPYLPGQTRTPHFRAVGMVHGRFPDSRPDELRMSENFNEARKILYDYPVFIPRDSVSQGSIHSIVHKEIAEMKGLRHLLPILLFCGLISLHKFLHCRMTCITVLVADSVYSFSLFANHSDQNESVAVYGTK
jgi:hypothetical protein